MLQTKTQFYDRVIMDCYAHDRKKEDCEKKAKDKGGNNEVS